MIEGNLVTTSTGVNFQIKKASPLAFREVQRRLEKEAPKVPVVHIQSKGREEENPSDPDYLKAIAEWEETRNLKLVDTAILLCTKPMQIPDGLSKHTDPDWLHDLRILGIAPPEGDERERYLAWVKYVAAPDPTDLIELERSVMKVMGVTEEEVSAAIASFPGNKGGDADLGTHPERDSEHGDNIREPVTRPGASN